jgi:hypothetical protein
MKQERKGNKMIVEYVEVVEIEIFDVAHYAN